MKFLFCMLLLAFSAHAEDFMSDVVVPVPDEISAYGTLKVEGTPGSGQSNEFRASKCKRDAQGNAAKFSCEESKTYTLNTAQELPVGFYAIFYSGSTT